MRAKSLTYVIRLWQGERDGKPVWHASLHNPYTEERYNFADFTDLLSFLKAMMAGSPWQDGTFLDAMEDDTTRV